MDWSTPELDGFVAETARPILTADPTGWAALADAELLAVEDFGAVCALLVEVGRAGARVPALETLVLGAAARALGPLPADAVLTAAFAEHGRPDPRDGSTVVRDGKAYGIKVAVPSADRAARFVLVTADGLWGVEAADASVEPTRVTNGDLWGTVSFDGAPATRLGDRVDVDAWCDRAHVALCALTHGLTQRAIELTATYVRERHQFSRPIGTFQAVSQRLADAWIDGASLDVLLTQAVWRVSSGLPSARELAILRAVTADASHRIVAAAQHLHGGFGFDRDYTLHRYFLTVKAWEFVLGGAGAATDRLGDLLAASPS